MNCVSLTLQGMKPTSLLLSLLTGLSMSVPAQTTRDPLAQSTQIIVVTTAAWSTVEGQLQRYERSNAREPWRPVGESFAVVVGKNGLGWGIGVASTEDASVRRPSDPVKQEGDGKDPAGIFALGTAFGYASQALQRSKLPYLALTSATECVDDVASKHYNQIVERTAITPDWSSSEHMRSAGESYRWGIVVDHNGTVTATSARSSVPGRGSCIFLHIWQGAGHGTVGCTAMPQSEVERLLQWLDPKRQPLLVQLPSEQYREFSLQWKLPTTTRIDRTMSSSTP